MTKPGLTEDKVDGLLASAAHGPGWALCIGAGTSLPVFPDWNTLVERLFARVSPDEPGLASALAETFSPDALIQAAYARTEGDDDHFASILSEALYRDLVGTFTTEEHRLVVRALSAVRPGDLPAAKWSRFLELLGSRWAGTMSCLSIAPVVSETLGTSRSPAAILSFNAEPLLLAVLNAHQAVHSGEAGVAGGVPQRVDRVVRGLSNRSVGRIPYVFCHGLLPIPGATVSPHGSAPDQLVFSESAYLQLASNVYSWQATSFLETCAARRVVFVGLSLTDANMRRWLSWVHDSRLAELELLGRPDAVSTQHLWLNVDPGDPERRAWIEASVAHLGVRLVWMSSWDSIGPALARMLEHRGT